MTNLPQTKNLILDISNGWLTIWLNRPNSRNALTNDMIEDFNNVFNSVGDDRSYGELLSGVKKEYSVPVQI